MVMYGGLLQSFSQLKPCPFLTATKQLVDRTKSPSTFFFFFDHLFHLGVRPNMKKKIFTDSGSSRL